MALENGSHARRSFLKGAAGVLGLGFWADEMLDALPQNTNTNSKPSDLKITDMRALTVRGAPITCPIIRIDTNQGIYGLGEVRDGASKTYPLFLKSRILGDSNPMTQHMFTGMEITEKGVQLMWDYVAQVREMVGMDIPLSADHFGHIGANSCIRLGKALTKYNMAWLEDMIPWQRTEQLKQIADAVAVPILTGEDMANVHCAAATENFLVLENHSVDVPWWSGLVEGGEKIVKKGFIAVPEKPGLGVTLNEAVVKQHLLEPGYFEPTPEWNRERSADRLWSWGSPVPLN